MASTTLLNSKGREELIHNVLTKDFNRKVLSMHNIGKNASNLVYRIDLAAIDDAAVIETKQQQQQQEQQKQKQPGTVPLPPTTTTAIMRLSNPDALLNEAVRVQNEVAAMSLFRQALASYTTPLIADVYGWAASNSTTPGWILQQYKPGVQLDTLMPTLNAQQKRNVVRQIGNVYKLIQDFALPDSVQGYGGLAFNDAGEIVTGPTTIPCGGPFLSVQDMYAQMLRRQLDEADTSSRIAGWRRNGLRERLERFYTGGIREVVVENYVDRATLVHADFDMYNMLIDPSSTTLSALLDFDLAHIATRAEECFYSFKSLSSLLAGPLESNAAEAQLRTYLLHGFDATVPSGVSEDGGVDWDLAALVDDEWRRAGVLRPGHVRGCGELAALKWFLEDVSPPYYYFEAWREQVGPERVEETLVEIEETLGKYLERWGY